jgi:hypothetical protein
MRCAEEEEEEEEKQGVLIFQHVVYAYTGTDVV